MFYVFSYTPTETLTEANAHEMELALTAGVIHQVDILFQSGCYHETFVQIFNDNFQLWPSNRGQSIKGDATVVSFRDFEELVYGNTKLTAKIWTSLDADWKEVIIQIGLLPKKVLQPMSFDDLLEAARGF